MFRPKAIWNMPVDLSIRDAPDQVVQRLRERAEKHHRSLQGEVIAILEAAVQDSCETSRSTALAELRALGLHTPGESVGFIRADRDGR